MFLRKVIISSLIADCCFKLLTWVNCKANKSPSRHGLQTTSVFSLSGYLQGNLNVLITPFSFRFMGGFQIHSFLSISVVTIPEMSNRIYILGRYQITLIVQFFP
jgi:hypothetical protein